MFTNRVIFLSEFAILVTTNLRSLEMLKKWIKFDSLWARDSVAMDTVSVHNALTRVKTAYPQLKTAHPQHKATHPQHKATHH